MIDYSKLHFRENTWDKNIFRSVAELNEYGLDCEFNEDDIVIDIGSHVGGFIWAAGLRGAKRIISFEAFEDNYELAKKNIDVLSTIIGKNNITVFNKAIYRSDLEEQNGTLHFSGVHNENTGGGNVLTNTSGLQVEWMSLDKVIDDKQIRMLKLDCEGSEFPILLTTKKLDQVQEIVGEFHEMDVPKHLDLSYEKFTMSLLKEHLESKGFEVTYKVHDSVPSLGVFRAINKVSFKL